MEGESFNILKNGGKLRKIISNNQEEDRLSSLTEPLLVEILSLLPIESAAATSALSRRWRHLWTQITTLRFSSGKHLPAVDHILPQLTSPLIRALVIRAAYCDQGFYASSIHSCFDHIRRRNDVETIEVSIETSEVKLPAWVFQCQSLVTLFLGGDWNFELFLDTSVINLPNLKKISMVIDDSARNLIGKLFASCPLLEILWVRFLFTMGDYESLINISSPNLKSLTIALCNCFPMRLKFAVNAPKLMRLRIEDFFSSSHYSFVTISSALMGARLCLSPEEGEDDGEISATNTQVPDLVRGITSVRSLDLNGCSEMLNYLGWMDDGAFPIFHNLTILKVSFDNGYGCWEDLLLSLRCFPNLEVLKVRRCPIEEEDQSGLESVPAHCLSKLKILEIQSLPLYYTDKMLLGYFLSNANALERLTVDVCVKAKEKEVRLWKEYEFCGTLFTLPRSSSTCEIEFNGAHIHNTCIW